jgi:hypothetical protein
MVKLPPAKGKIVALAALLGAVVGGGVFAAMKMRGPEPITAAQIAAPPLPGPMLDGIERK